MSILTLTDLSVDYRSRSGAAVPAVRDISLSIGPGEMAAVVGESGSGKSTTAAAIMGLLPGNAEIVGGAAVLSSADAAAPAGASPAPGTELTRLSPRGWSRIRGREIGYVPQDPGTSLNPVKTVGENVAETLRIHTSLTRAERRARVVELLDAVGIDRPELRADQHPHELSGGMRQRALIAAAIAMSPRLLIADEPTSALDVTVQKRILDLLDSLRAERGMAVVLITHDLAVAAERADTITVVRSGRVEESGSAARVLSSPASEYTRRLLADAPSFSLGARTRAGAAGSETASAPRPGSAPTGAAPIGSAPIGSSVPAAGPSAVRPHTAAEAASSAADAPPLVSLDSVSRVYARSAEGIIGVEDVSLSIPRGRTLGLVGESGSGKSTIGRALTAFTGIDSGAIRVGDLDPSAKGRRAQRAYRRRVQLVHQNPASALDPMHTVGSSIAEPLRSFRIGTRADRADRVAQAMELVSLDPALARRRPRELSGGQLQRVAIARALVVEPELVVFDEAVSALDVTVQAQILALISRLQEELGLTYLFISHDLAVVEEVAHSVAVLSRGRVVESGPTDRVLGDPQDAYTRRLLAAIPQPLRRAEADAGPRTAGGAAGESDANAATTSAAEATSPGRLAPARMSHRLSKPAAPALAL